ncbi:MAG TPA: pyridoxamine 5'-phosphate oxidase family protein [Polyangiaceae bacterium]|nr:pyridoxamine 5'-phosphate oxidase family protein [Polyangiaceae bacterium]
MTEKARRAARVIDRGWTHESSPFHAGEQEVQRRLGVRDQIERAGRNMLRDHMPDQHRELFVSLPMLVVGSVNANGRLWASILGGKPGFVDSPSPKLLKVTTQPVPGDPLSEQLAVGNPLGLLGIQLETRRRNRANGRIVARDERSFTVEVEQSFGNCKQYIQAREPTFDARLLGSAGAVVAESERLSAKASELLARADTFFIATASASAASGKDGEGVDVSHRGGRPGFVRVGEGSHGTRLTVPDFRGNFIFNTFGNLEVNPRAGIVCPDFRTGDVLSLTGTARVIWEGEELDAFEGAHRLLSFDVESGVLLERALPLRFDGLEPSPDLADTGIWAENEFGSEAPHIDAIPRP